MFGTESTGNSASELWELAGAWFPTATSTLANMLPASGTEAKLDNDFDKLGLLPTKDREAMLRYRCRAETAVSNAEAGELEHGLSRLRDWGMTVKWPEVDGDDSPTWGDVSPRWKRLGFQSADPRRDFRTGMLALDNLVYFCELHSSDAEKIFVEARSITMNYPLVVASINLTQLLAWYLSILGGPCPLGATNDIQPLDDPMQLHAFARLCVDQDAFGELHSMSLIRLHSSWSTKKRNDPTANVSIFGDCLQEALAKVDDVMRTSSFENTLELRFIAV